MANPYSPPGPSGGYVPPPYPQYAPPQNARGSGLTVLAYFAVIFGSLGLLGAPMTLAGRFIARDPVSRRTQEIMWEGALGVWTSVSLFIGLILSIVLLSAGIGIFKMRPWARRLSLIYGVIGVVTGILHSIVHFALYVPAMARLADEFPRNPMARAGAIGGAIGGVIGALFGLALPVTMLIVMTRPLIQAKFQAQRPHG